MGKKQGLYWWDMSNMGYVLDGVYNNTWVSHRRSLAECAVRLGQHGRHFRFSHHVSTANVGVGR